MEVGGDGYVCGPDVEDLTDVYPQTLHHKAHEAGISQSDLSRPI